MVRRSQELTDSSLNFSRKVQAANMAQNASLSSILNQRVIHDNGVIGTLRYFAHVGQGRG